MTEYQNYLKKAKKLSEAKDKLYDIAGFWASEGNAKKQRAAYADIDAIQQKLDSLVNPQDKLLGNDLLF